MTPQRITRQPAPGWKKPEGAIIVDRTSKLWGNPWGIGTPGTIDLVLDGVKTRYQIDFVIDANTAFSLFENWLRGGQMWQHPMPNPTLANDFQMMRDHLHARRQLILGNLDQLRGHDLCCWCKPGQPCHADVLLRLANGGG